MTNRVLLVLAAGVLVAAAEPKDDQKKMQGDWHVVGMERGGQKAPEEDLKKLDMRLTIDGNKFKYTVGGKASDEGTFTLSKDNQLDAVGTNPDGKEHKTVGIYEIKGDTMRVCLVPDGETRPEKFATKEGEKTMILTYKRAKK
jgi:uncharacterized protein (TIGR03067 family)